jgi:hypothetical protein
MCIMSRTIVAALVLLLAGSVASCQSDLPTEAGLPDVSSVPLATRGQPDQALPFQASGTADITGMQYAPDFPFGLSDFDGRCSVPSSYVIGFTGTARVSHLGKVGVVFEHCSLLDPTTGASTYGDGVLTFTAANGDELRGTYHSGSGAFVSETDVEWGDTFVLDGGTGRFAAASGGGTDHGTTNWDTGYTVFQSWGVIVYDASDRRSE